MKRLLGWLAAVILLVGGALGLSPVAAADPLDWHFEHDAFAWLPTDGTAQVNDAAASSGTFMRAKQNTTAYLTGWTPPITNIKIRAKGKAYNGTQAKMKVSLNDTVLGEPSVTSSWADYNFSVNVPAGLNQLQVSFTNEACGWWFWDYICNRELHFDYAVITVDHTPAEPNPDPTPPNEVRYVAMGDSYSAGGGANQNPGVPIDWSIYDGTDCGRASTAAQVLLAAERDWDLVNVACGGAAVQHILDESYLGEPPQIEAVTSDTDVVTFTIGGNDAALMWMLAVCVQQWDCVPENPWSNIFIQQMNQKINAVQGKVENVLRAILDRAPNAKIRPAGYPYILPPPGEPQGRCDAWLTNGEQQMFANAIINTNNKIKAAVNAVKAEYPSADIVYVDPLAAGSPFLQRGPEGLLGDGCSPIDMPTRYMNGPETDLWAGGWHPNMNGQQHYKALYAASLP